MARRIDEATARGMTTQEALELAMRENGLSPPVADDETTGASHNLTGSEANDDREPWLDQP